MNPKLLNPWLTNNCLLNPASEVARYIVVSDLLCVRWSIGIGIGILLEQVKYGLDGLY